MKQQDIKNSNGQQVILGLLLLMLSSIVSAKTVTTYYHSNLQGSPVFTTSESGSWVWQKHYRPFGDAISYNQSGDDNNESFTGYMKDDDAGLMYAGARWYNPEIGRFISLDPVRPTSDNPISLNRYAYSNNDPYGYIDPDGRKPEKVSAWKSFRSFVFGAFLMGADYADGKFIDNNKRGVTLVTRLETEARQRVELDTINAIKNTPGQSSKKPLDIAVDIIESELSTPAFAGRAVLASAGFLVAGSLWPSSLGNGDAIIGADYYNPLQQYESGLNLTPEQKLFLDDAPDWAPIMQ